MNKGFIFDWSGTLSDNFSSFCQVCDLIFVELGRQPISREEIRLNFTMPFMKFWNRYFPDLTIEYERELYEKFIHQVDEPHVFGGAKETLRHINKSGFKIFVVSSDPLSKLLPEVQRSGLSDLFTEVIGEIDDKRETLASTVTRYGLQPGFSFYVGDTSGDVEHGKAAKLRTIGVSTGYQHRAGVEASHPDFLFDDLLQIKSIV